PLRIQFGDCFEALQFVGERQAIAALHLDGGDAEREESPQATSCQVLQLLLRGLADAPHRGVDASTTGSDLLVGEPLEALLELVLARAGEDQVRVTVDEA